MFLPRIFLTLFCCVATYVSAVDQVTIGPEGYYAKRTRAGGSEESGGMYGGHISYDRVRRSALYWGCDYSVAYGKLTGHSGDNAIASWALDQTLEGRIGYTLGCKWRCRPRFTPFVGLGYFYQTNRFVDPSPLHLMFRNTFLFGTVGFRAGVQLTDHLQSALLFRAKWMQDGRQRITGEGIADKITLGMEDEWQYEVELPFDYTRGECCAINFQVTPFYRYRHYGAKPAYPVSFQDTTWQNYGLRLLATYRF